MRSVRTVLSHRRKDSCGSRIDSHSQYSRTGSVLRWGSTQMCCKILWYLRCPSEGTIRKFSDVKFRIHTFVLDRGSMLKGTSPYSCLAYAHSLSSGKTMHSSCGCVKIRTSSRTYCSQKSQELPPPSSLCTHSQIRVKQ